MVQQAPSPGCESLDTVCVEAAYMRQALSHVLLCKFLKQSRGTRSKVYDGRCTVGWN